nr:hypothetical protein [Candidatus Sigynarchaeota archaeon]
MSFDHVFKEVMRVLFGARSASPEEVGKLPLHVDMVVTCDGGPLASSKVPLLGRHFSRENLFEYKSSRDHPVATDLAKLLGYVGLHAEQHGIDIDGMATRLTAWYVTAKRPAFLDGLVASGTAVSTSEPGVYDIVGRFPCPCRVVVCDEVAVNGDNVPLLVLGTIETIKVGIRYIAGSTMALRHAMERIITTIYLFYHDEVKGMTEMNEILPAEIRRNVKHAIEDLGLDSIIEEIGIDKVIDSVGIDKVIDSVGIDKVIDSVGIDKVIDSVGI